MWTGDPWVLLAADSRGNRLEDYRVLVRQTTGEHFVVLRAVDEIAAQVWPCLQDADVAAVDATGVVSNPGRWTHACRFDGPYTARLRDLLELLRGVLTFPAVKGLSVALALDFYKTPPDPAAGKHEWGWTEVGDLVYRKYWTDNPAAQNEAGSRLSQMLVDVVAKHPQLHAAQTVITIPGTQHTFGQRLASTVAHRSNKRCLQAVCQAPDRKPAKQGHDTSQLDPYVIAGSVAGEAVIIVDDVYRSGVTMRSVAAAALTAGAIEVVGLVAARTLRAR